MPWFQGKRTQPHQENLNRSEVIPLLPYEDLKMKT